MQKANAAALIRSKFRHHDSAAAGHSPRLPRDVLAVHPSPNPRWLGLQVGGLGEYWKARGRLEFS